METLVKMAKSEWQQADVGEFLYNLVEMLVQMDAENTDEE